MAINTKECSSKAGEMAKGLIIMQLGKSTREDGSTAE